MHFDGHGKWTLKGEILNIRTSLGTNPNTDIPVTQMDLDVAGTYVLDSVGNGLFVDITSPTYTVTLKSGVVLKFSGPITARGRLDTVTGSSTVIISQTIPEIEEQEIIVAPSTPPLGMKEQRICNGTGSLVQLSPWRNWFSKNKRTCRNVIYSPESLSALPAGPSSALPFFVGISSANYGPDVRLRRID